MARPRGRRPLLRAVRGAWSLPYYVNGLQDRPPGETLYLYELSGLWPYDTAWAGCSRSRRSAMPLAPFVAAVGRDVVGHSASGTRGARMTRSAIALYAAAAVVAVASIAWLATPLASELFVWFVD